MTYKVRATIETTQDAKSKEHAQAIFVKHLDTGVGLLLSTIYTLEVIAVLEAEQPTAPAEDPRARLIKEVSKALGEGLTEELQELLK